MPTRTSTLPRGVREIDDINAFADNYEGGDSNVARYLQILQTSFRSIVDEVDRLGNACFSSIPFVGALKRSKHLKRLSDLVRKVKEDLGRMDVPLSDPESEFARVQAINKLVRSVMSAVVKELADCDGNKIVAIYEDLSSMQEEVMEQLRQAFDAAGGKSRTQT
jgi:hypothetical protein